VDLRPYQTKAIVDARSEMARGARKVLVVCPTGGGKTVLAAEIIRSAVARGSRVLFLAHRRELITQTCDKLHRFGVEHGVIQAGFRPAPHRPVQVASVQTLIRRPEACTRADLIFVDEAHHLTLKNTYAKLLAWYPQARVVGLTATPWRLDGAGLADVFDGYVLACTPRELREAGFLVPVGGWQYEGIDTSHARVQHGDFVAGDVQRAAMSGKVVGDVVGEWKEHAAGRRTVLFAVTVEHSQKMVAAFQAAGVAAEHLDGETPTEQRDGILARLRSGQTLVVSNCNVLTEGFDCPELEVALLCRPTLSTSLYLQMVGRILRPSAGKTLARIHDHANCLAAHGHPFADRDYSPQKSSRAERSATEKDAAKKKCCPKCEAVLARWPCDACGFSPTPVELQLEFEEAARKKRIEEVAAAAAVKAPESDMERRAKWLKRFAQDDEWKRNFFDRMVAKHGAVRGRQVYFWFSGKSEWPRREWVEAPQEAGAPA
jgi:superfamily II DNA or RNA helicase